MSSRTPGVLVPQVEYHCVKISANYSHSVDVNTLSTKGSLNVLCNH
jgi:hypothetical protein